MIILHYNNTYIIGSGFVYMVCVKEVKPRKVISAAIIYDKRILVVKKRHSWILPGGKPERNESALECLSLFEW